MKSRKGCVVGTSIHKDKSSGASPKKFIGGLVSQALPGKAGNIAGKVLNPMGAVLDKTGMKDTTLGKVLDPASMLANKM
jgi:hypothetical protein